MLAARAIVVNQEGDLAIKGLPSLPTFRAADAARETISLYVSPDRSRDPHSHSRTLRSISCPLRGPSRRPNLTKSA